MSAWGELGARQGNRSVLLGSMLLLGGALIFAGRQRKGAQA